MTWVNYLHALNFYLIQQLINAKKTLKGKVDHIAFFQETLTGENTEIRFPLFITFPLITFYKYITQGIHTCSMESGHMYRS